MPFNVLIALVVAFGIPTETAGAPLPWRGTLWGVFEALACVGVQTSFSWVCCRILSGRARASSGHSAARRALSLGSRLTDLLALIAYAVIVHVFDWPRVVGSGLGLRRAILIDEVLVLLPFLVAQVLSWACVYPLDLRLRDTRGGTSPARGLGGYVIRRARQSFGLVLPAAFLYALVYDLIRIRWPDTTNYPYVQFVAIALLGGLILILAPALIRLSWDTRPLPAGPLRKRLERLSERLDFRFSDILIWDTERNVVNAGVTGALPWFRYVLLTDALIDSLGERQIEAVFGHEVGHVAHRHLAYFGFFCVGSMGIMALVCQGISGLSEFIPIPSWLSDRSTPILIVESALALSCLGLYFYIFFGFLSRRFERQADVYGCRAVSCGHDDCPPHAEPAPRAPARAFPSVVCPVGIQTFASALAEVAALNGLEPAARSWRHGSIKRRIAFLEGLEGRPEAERRFQSGVRRLRFVLALVLIVSLAAAVMSGALEQL